MKLWPRHLSSSLEEYWWPCPLHFKITPPTDVLGPCFCPWGSFDLYGLCIFLCQEKVSCASVEERESGYQHPELLACFAPFKQPSPPTKGLLHPSFTLLSTTILVQRYHLKIYTSPWSRGSHQKSKYQSPVSKRFWNPCSFEDHSCRENNLFRATHTSLKGISSNCIWLLVKLITPSFGHFLSKIFESSVHLFTEKYFFVVVYWFLGNL